MRSFSGCLARPPGRIHKLLVKEFGLRLPLPVQTAEWWPGGESPFALEPGLQMRRSIYALLRWPGCRMRAQARIFRTSCRLKTTAVFFWAGAGHILSQSEEQEVASSSASEVKSGNLGCAWPGRRTHRHNRTGFWGSISGGQGRVRHCAQHPSGLSYHTENPQ